MCGCKGRAEGWSWPGPGALTTKEGETDDLPVAYRAPLRRALIDDNAGHVTW